MHSAYPDNHGERDQLPSMERGARFKRELLSAQIGIELGHCESILSESEGAGAYAHERFCACRQMLKNPLVRFVVSARSRHDLFDWIRGFKRFAICGTNGDIPCQECSLSELKVTIGDMRAALEGMIDKDAQDEAPAERLESVLTFETEVMGLRDKVFRTARFYDGAYRALVGSRIMSVMRKLFGPDDDSLLLHAELPDSLSSHEDFQQNPFTQSVFEQLMAESDGLSRSNGSLIKRADIQLGLVSDEFAYLNYRDYVNVNLVNMGNVEAVVASGVMDALLCTSCWYGLASTPDGVTTLMDFDGDEGVDNLRMIVQRAQEASIPVLFQSFEDPPSYDRFLPVAQASNVIFTTAVECIVDYERDTKVPIIQQMGFGINSLIHNPIGAMRRYLAPRDNRRVLFAGAWYEKFAQRCLDTMMLFDGAIACEDVQFLCIDRNLGAGDPLRTFPIRYNAYLCRPIEYQRLQAFVKEFDWVLNLNSVTTSTTMCARRVYELQASGALVISNYSEAISHLFPSVFTVFTSDEVGRIIHGYTLDEEMSIQIEQVRDVLSQHTNAHRLASMLECVDVSLPLFEPVVEILCDPSDKAVLDDIALQTYEKHLIVDREQVGALDPNAPHFVIDWGAPQGNPFYLEDLVNAFAFVDVDYVFYGSRDDLASAYEYVRDRPVPLGALRHLEPGWTMTALLGASDSSLGFSVLSERWGRDTSSSEKDLAVVVPYRGELDAFHRRMFRSLLRSTSFARMSIHVVDLREENMRTDRHILDYLYRDYDNVRFAERSLEDALSAVEEEFVIVLHPAYEAVGDGLSGMLGLAKGTGAQCVVARMRDVSNSGEPLVGSKETARGSGHRVVMVRRDGPCLRCVDEMSLCIDEDDVVYWDGVAVVCYGVPLSQ